MDTEKYLSNTDSLVDQLFWFYQDFGIQPAKDHIGTSIDFSDISEKKHEFISELSSTIVNWVFSKRKVREIIDKRMSEVNDLGNASNYLTSQAYLKFRPNHPQGQFGELLLFNFLQHFFKAVPLLRKQKITTSTGHERYGADAIHYKFQDPTNLFYLGESKCYKSNYSFNAAFKASIKSICESFNNLDKELSLYIHDDFIEPDFKNIAYDLKKGKIENLQYELVCMIAYNEDRSLDGDKEMEIKESIKNVINQRCDNINADCFLGLEGRILSRINYIIFPIWNLDDLLNEFHSLVRR